MTNTYKFNNSTNTIVLRSDDAHIPWDPANNCPIDIGGWVGRVWVDDGSPTPDTYVEPTLTPQQLYANAISSGLTINWTESNNLNGTFNVDDQSRSFIVAETVSILLNNTMTNGANSRYWQDASGNLHLISVTQFVIFATTVAQYVDACQAALVTNTAMPNNIITIVG